MEEVRGYVEGVRGWGVSGGGEGGWVKRRVASHIHVRVLAGALTRCYIDRWLH